MFEDAIVGGSIPRQFIPSVEKGIVKAMARGFLAGFQMIDVKVRLYDGKYHDVDSSDAAFQLAGSKGFKAAVRPGQARAARADREAPGDRAERRDGRRDRRHQQPPRPRQRDGHASTTTRSSTPTCPLSEVLEYESKLKSMTQGKGTFSMSVDHLEICPPIVQDKVIKDSGFKVEADEE